MMKKRRRRRQFRKFRPGTMSYCIYNRAMLLLYIEICQIQN